MELYKNAVTNELRNMLTVWELVSVNPNSTFHKIGYIRRKINGLCDLLDKIEREEQRKAA
jgi:hypothetical protein